MDDAPSHQSRYQFHEAAVIIQSVIRRFLVWRSYQAAVDSFDMIAKRCEQQMQRYAPSYTFDCYRDKLEGHYLFDIILKVSPFPPSNQQYSSVSHDTSANALPPERSAHSESTNPTAMSDNDNDNFGTHQRKEGKNSNAEDIVQRATILSQTKQFEEEEQEDEEQEEKIDQDEEEESSVLLLNDPALLDKLRSESEWLEGAILQRIEVRNACISITCHVQITYAYTLWVLHLNVHLYHSNYIV